MHIAPPQGTALYFKNIMTLARISILSNSMAHLNDNPHAFVVSYLALFLIGNGFLLCHFPDFSFLLSLTESFLQIFTAALTHWFLFTVQAKLSSFSWNFLILAPKHWWSILIFLNFKLSSKQNYHLLLVMTCNKVVKNIQNEMFAIIVPFFLVFFWMFTSLLTHVGKTPRYSSTNCKNMALFTTPDYFESYKALSIIIFLLWCSWHWDPVLNEIFSWQCVLKYPFLPSHNIMSRSFKVAIRNAKSTQPIATILQ